jgi:transposase InsO family protein
MERDARRARPATDGNSAHRHYVDWLADKWEQAGLAVQRDRLTMTRWAPRRWSLSVTGEPIRRYEHDRPGALIHVDVTKFGNVPDGGGWRYVGKQQGDRNRSATVARTGAPRSKTRAPLMGTAFVHTVVDDHSRVAYAEFAPMRRRSPPSPSSSARSPGSPNAGSPSNASCPTTARPTSPTPGAACTALGIAHKRTRPYRPQTNGKIERFLRTLADGWADARLYDSKTARRDALPAWLHFYNHHRAHSAIGGLPPTAA